MTPCPARVAAVLGLLDPVTLPCVLLAEHGGRHFYHIEWSDE